MVARGWALAYILLQVCFVFVSWHDSTFRLKCWTYELGLTDEVVLVALGGFSSSSVSSSLEVHTFGLWNNEIYMKNEWRNLYIFLEIRILWNKFQIDSDFFFIWHNELQFKLQLINRQTLLWSIKTLSTSKARSVQIEISCIMYIYLLAFFHNYHSPTRRNYK